MQSRFELLLEGAKWFSAINPIRLCLTVDRIRDDKTRCPGYIGGLSILSILLNTVLKLATAVTTIELIHVKTSLFSNSCQTFIGEGTRILAERIRKKVSMHLPEFILVTGTIRRQRGIL